MSRKIMTKLDTRAIEAIRDEVTLVKARMYDFLKDLDGEEQLRNLMDIKFEALYELVELRQSPRKNAEAIQEKITLALDEIRDLHERIQFRNPIKSNNDALLYQTLAKYLDVGMLVARESQETARRYNGLRQARLDAYEAIGMPLDHGMYQ